MSPRRMTLIRLSMGGSRMLGILRMDLVLERIIMTTPMMISRTDRIFMNTYLICFTFSDGLMQIQRMS